MKTIYSCLLVVLIAITLACGYGSKNYNTSPGAIPAISQLSPDNTNAGTAAFMMTVNGNNFASNANVNWNGVAQRTTYVTGSQLMVAIPAAMISNSGTAQITVTNPASIGNGPYGMGGVLAQTSQPVTFTIN
ncbi:MAG TPA: IPT/TIG domain-containing protein [Candidatus Eisenbacteria bacterium]|nr:IPT/TIG domain-containing protein [Candidatus Eisenbacteria bacterium]